MSGDSAPESTAQIALPMVFRRRKLSLIQSAPRANVPCGRKTIVTGSTGIVYTSDALESGSLGLVPIHRGDDLHVDFWINGAAVLAPSLPYGVSEQSHRIGSAVEEEGPQY